MLEEVKQILALCGIERVGIISIKDCDIINERILPDEVKSAILFCIPYRSTAESANDGFSEYARIYDYHKYASSLYEDITEKMSDATGYMFYGFCDHSPINEKTAIAKCGLGVIGRNSLFIDNVYGSFVFIGSILTNAETESNPCGINTCINCQKCVTACPAGAICEKGIDRFKCLSAISQKKNKSDEEKLSLKTHNIVWGCDICQNVCPYNKNAKISPIPYFKNTRIGKINKAFIENLTDDEFKKYAFSYKGRKIVLDNIDFI